MTHTEPSGQGSAARTAETPHMRRFNQMMTRMESQRAPVVHLSRRRWSGLPELPYASLSVLIILLSLFSLSMYLGGWTWSSWTYAFSLGLAFPLVAIEMKRKAVITGGAMLLLAFTVIIDAGLPKYFGYSPSHLSWYDLTAHFLGALFMTILLWSVICWTTSPTGPPKVNGRRKMLLAVMVMLIVSIGFEFAEFITDVFFGWRNFHPGIDTLGDLIFDIAGVMTAALLISRHRVSALKMPFWHSEAARA